MIYAFDDFELDTQHYELRRVGKPCKVEPKAFDLLVYLVQHRDRAVTRDELCKHVWTGEFISDAVLSHHVMVARKAVGDDGRAQRVIKTVHGRGYRFIAAVDSVADRRYMQRSVSTPPASGPELTPSVNPAVAAQRDMEPEALPNSQNVLAGEHMLGTVLCVILDYVQKLSEQLTLGALQRLRQTFFTTAQGVIQQYQGTVQFYGADGILALFGAPPGQSDHARRGLSAAVTLHRHLRDAYANPEVLPPSAYSVSQGLHTGPVARGNFTGETPNLAIWFQYQAEPDTILISGATMRLVEDLVSNTERGTIRIPGHPAPITAYKLIALRA
jgi:DNA-binding winged helix-turn-helix (wHTH) protein